MWSGGRAAVLVRDEDAAALAVLFERMAPPSGQVMGTFYDREKALAFLGKTALPAGCRRIR